MQKKIYARTELKSLGPVRTLTLGVFGSKRDIGGFNNNSIIKFP